MHLDNGTPYPAGFTLGMDAEGREHVVVVVKATFDIPEKAHLPPVPSEEQEPLLTADTFWGEPGLSAPREEMDFAHVKPRCDVLLDATAHAPGGRAVEHLQAGLRVGSWAKTIDVIGDRVWLSGVGPPRISDPRPFVTMPLSYDRAFGGVDLSDPNDEMPGAYLANPVGRGWHTADNVARLTGQPLPNLERPFDRVTAPWVNASPAGFGPIGRGWSDRLRFAGTYDQNWIDNVFPFLPADFDPRYYQAAAEDQQIPSPARGTEVVLANLSPRGTIGFRLPETDLPVVFARARDEDAARAAHMDTLVIKPDLMRFTMTWRASVALRRDLFEVPECIIGRRSRTFWRARALGKTYHPSLGDLVRSRTREPAE